MKPKAKLKGVFFSLLEDKSSFYYYPKEIKERHLEEMREMMTEFETQGCGTIQDSHEMKYYRTYYKLQSNKSQEIQIGRGNQSKSQLYDEEEGQDALFIIVIANFNYPEATARQFIDSIGNAYKKRERFNANNQLSKEVMRLIKGKYAKYRHLYSNSLIPDIAINEDFLDNEEDLNVSSSSKYHKPLQLKRSALMLDDSYLDPKKITQEHDVFFAPYQFHLIDKDSRRQTVFVLKKHEQEEIAYWGKAKRYMAFGCGFSFLITISSLVLILKFYVKL